MDAVSTGAGLTAGDRDQLEDSARRRAARLMLWRQGLYYVGIVVVGLTVGVDFVARHHLSGGKLATAIGVDAGIVVLVGSLIALQYWWVRRHGTIPLVYGADRPTRRAAGRALKAGSSSDARLDDLISDERIRWRKRRPILVVAAVLLIGGGIAFGLTGDSLHVRVQGYLMAALAALAVVNFAIMGRRLRNYRNRHAA
jgi:hypothetical protein